MHNRRPLRIASTIGSVETGLLPALEAAYFTDRPDLEIMVEGDPRLLNVLSAPPIKPPRAADVNERGAEAFLNWVRADEAQSLIGDLGPAEHGISLFLRRDQVPAT